MRRLENAFRCGFPGRACSASDKSIVATLAAEHDLPATGVPPEWERLLSAIFVCSPNYGTRASTLYLRHRSGEALLLEKSFSPTGEEIQFSQISTGV